MVYTVDGSSTRGDVDEQNDHTWQQRRHQPLHTSATSIQRHTGCNDDTPQNKWAFAPASCLVPRALLPCLLSSRVFSRCSSPPFSPPLLASAGGLGRTHPCWSPCNVPATTNQLLLHRVSAACLCRHAGLFFCQPAYPRPALWPAPYARPAELAVGSTCRCVMPASSTRSWRSWRRLVGSVCNTLVL